MDIHSNYLIDLNVTELFEYLPNLQQLAYDGNEVACERVIEINEELSNHKILTQFFHYRRERYHETSKVDSITCLPDKDWAAVHYRKIVTGKIKQNPC